MSDKRLIDANALPVHWGFISYDVGIVHGRFVAVDDIEDAPTIDAVEVVRCGECWRRQTVNCPMFLRGGDYACRDGFCHMGAKMDGGATDGSDA